MLFVYGSRSTHSGDAWIPFGTSAGQNAGADAATGNEDDDDDDDDAIDVPAIMQAGAQTSTLRTGSARYTTSSDKHPGIS